MELDDGILSSYLSLNKLFVNQTLESKVSKNIEDKIAAKNVVMFYQLAKMFQLTSLNERTFNSIERCFALLARTPNFLNLDSTLVAKILMSSDLYVTSELEVLDAVVEWLKYDIKERTKFSKNLLLKVRFSLISDNALTIHLNNTLYTTDFNECVSVLEDVLSSKENYIGKNYSYYHKHRCCNHKKFDMLVCGGFTITSQTTVRSMYRVEEEDFKVARVLSPMTKERRLAKAVCLKNDVYLFGGFDGDIEDFTTVDKYSLADDVWSTVAEMYDDRRDFCACAFMHKVFIMGGDNETKISESCLQFDANDCSWKVVARMSELRLGAACAVFEGNIVVAGGYDIGIGEEMTDVSFYDPTADNWSFMANMVTDKYAHNLLVANNKLFVIGFGRNGCEIYDRTCETFVALKSPSEGISMFNTAVSIGSKILLFQESERHITCYDVDRNTWSCEALDVPDNLVFPDRDFSCVKFP